MFGSGIYIARRMLPNIRTPPPGKPFDGTRSQHSTFVERLDRVLDAAASSPGLAWPIYTHLGALERGAISGLPSPYLEGAALGELQDRVFNLSGTVAADRRTWFCRASTLYDYALMLRKITDRVERPDPDTVSIRSWNDPILDTTLPLAPSQLYGLTFYVDDPRRARVLLDGEPIPTLVRNPPDATGRPSVTVAECEIRHVLFERLDPAHNLPDEIGLEGEWQWREDEGRAFGRLTAADGDRLARLRLPLFGLQPWGAQLLALDLRRPPGARLGLLIESRTGGRFFFGDPGLDERLEEPPTARYLFAPDDPPGWRRLVAPFHDLDWAPGAQPGAAPMPNHPLEALTLLAEPGDDGQGVDLAGVALLRPRATGLGADAYCMAGRVPDFEPHQRVFAAAAEAPSSEVHECAVDPRGHFCFSRLPPGIYRLWTESGKRQLCDRRGPLVELSANLPSLVLDRPVADSSNAAGLENRSPAGS